MTAIRLSERERRQRQAEPEPLGWAADMKPRYARYDTSGCLVGSPSPDERDPSGKGERRVASFRHLVQLWFIAALRSRNPAVVAWADYAALVAERDALREVCAEAYQMAGALDAPVEALDNLSAAASGKPLPHKTFLPVSGSGGIRSGVSGIDRSDCPAATDAATVPSGDLAELFAAEIEAATIAGPSECAEAGRNCARVASQQRVDYEAAYTMHENVVEQMSGKRPKLNDEGKAMVREIVDAALGRAKEK